MRGEQSDIADLDGIPSGCLLPRTHLLIQAHGRAEGLCDVELICGIYLHRTLSFPTARDGGWPWRPPLALRALSDQTVRAPLRHIRLRFLRMLASHELQRCLALTRR